MAEKWISQNAYMDKYHIGFAEVKHLMNTGQVEWRTTEGGQIRIKDGGDSVSREMYEQEKTKRIEAETTLENLKNMIFSVLKIDKTELNLHKNY